VSWVETNRVYTHDQHSGPTIIFVGTTAPGLTPDAWHTIDLKPHGVTADAKWAEIVMHLIITHGALTGIANLTATFRPPGATLDAGNYQMQTIEPWTGGGERGSQMVRVGLVDGCFEFYWKKHRAGVPDVDPSQGGSDYLLNGWLQAWGRYVAEAPPPAPPMTIIVPPGGASLNLVQGAS
jgi:hypothetical protein